MLLGEHFFEKDLLALFKRRQLAARLVAFFILALLVHRRIAGKTHLGVICAEHIACRIDIDNDVIIHCICHLARGKASPDQTIKAILLVSKILAHNVGTKLNICRTDSLVRVLRAGFGFKHAERAVVVFLPVVVDYIVFRCHKRFVGKAQGVGSHVGYKADCAVTFDINAFIKLLRDRHGAAWRHAESAACLLLEGRCDKRR